MVLDVWSQLRPSLALVDDVVTFPWITVFSPRKDRPVLFTAYEHADVLLTLDRADFTTLLGQRFYSLLLQTPGDFIRGVLSA
jgi:hypothetical protein